MQIRNIGRDDLQNILAQLDQALYNHKQWCNTLTRTLICRMPPDKNTMSADAHKVCLFGQWYYGQAPVQLKEHPGFIAIGEAHQNMHRIATEILQINMTGIPISGAQYDQFSSMLERMQLEIFSIKNEIEISLYNHDPLTGAINRVDMLPSLREQHELVKRLSYDSCLAMMDLDSFKKTNDKYGHPAGDKVLATVIRFLMEHLRSYDKVFRYGGEEFLICMPHTTLKEGYEILKRLNEEISKLPIDIGRGEAIHITASFGLTLFDPSISVEECIDRSDKAMYAVKARGRNNTLIWESVLG